MSVLHWKKRNAKRKKEIPEGECVAVEKEKCESERRRGKCGDGNEAFNRKALCMRYRTKCA